MEKLLARYGPAPEEAATGRSKRESWKATTGTASANREKANTEPEESYLDLLQVKDGDKRDRNSSGRKKGKRRTCSACEHSWVDYWRKDECPKCLASLSAPRKRGVGESSTNPQKPSSAMESSSGRCPNKGGPARPHLWKWGKCSNCGKGQGDESKDAARAAAKEKVQGDPSRGGDEYADEAALVLIPAAGKEKRECPTCGYKWNDCYARNECPKCMCPIDGKKTRRKPGETSTFMAASSSAMESASGQCPAGEQGAKHQWKWGRCSLCLKGEGEEAKEKQARAPSECRVGGRHVFKFGKCVKCQTLENLRIKAGSGAESGVVEPAQPQRAEPIWMRCPRCTFNWLDSYRKNECPKCLSPLGPDPERSPRGQRQGASIPLAVQMQVDARCFPGVARVATEAVTSYVRPKSARNPGGYESPRRPESRPSSARAPRGEASAFQAASTFHPGFTKAGREFAVPYGFWDRPESRPSSARAPRGEASALQAASAFHPGVTKACREFAV
jgi:hypothetical protein